MKILLIHNSYQQYGGEDKVFNAELNLLQGGGQQVITYVRKNTEISNYELMEKIRFVKNTLWSKRTEKEILELCSRERPNVAHLHNIFPLISPSVYDALNNAKVPIVQTLHNYRFLCPNGLFYRKGSVCELCKKGNVLYGVMHKCYQNNYLTSGLYASSIGLVRLSRKLDRVRKFIALTPFVGNQYVEGQLIPEEKITCLGNFIVQYPQGSKLLQSSPGTYALYFGRISKEKGVQTLLAAFEKMPHIHLKIAGTGPQLESLVRYVQSRNMTNIEFVGFQEKKELLDLIRKAFVSIIPSECFDVFPLASLESMSVGTPVIASRIGGLPDVIEDGKSGLLFQPKDSGELQEKVEYLFSHPSEAEQMGEYAQNIVRVKYSPEIHYQKLMDIYHSVSL
ncbi:MAG: glycosyltransferase family 4 protein [Anaerolineaceae bacterium]|nr:glycosyltransferase family 4 protein [Anaerolineaceae bacterium]